MRRLRYWVPGRWPRLNPVSGVCFWFLFHSECRRKKNACHWLCDRSQPIKREREGGKKTQDEWRKKRERWEGRHEASVSLPTKARRGVAESSRPAKAAFRLTPSSPSSQSRCLSRSDCRGCGNLKVDRSAALVKASVNGSSRWCMVKTVTVSQGDGNKQAEAGQVHRQDGQNSG